VRAETVPALKSPEEQTAWNAIAARFSGEPTERMQDSTDIAVTGLKADPKGATATASMTIDKSTGHVVGVSSNAASQRWTIQALRQFPGAEVDHPWTTAAGSLAKASPPSPGCNIWKTDPCRRGSILPHGRGAKLKACKSPIWHCAFDDAGVALLKGSPDA